MKTWLNLIGYQAVWLIAVGGAGRGWWWAGPLAMLPFAAAYLARRDGWRDAVLLVVIGIGGSCLDSLLAASGLLAYAAAQPSPRLAPVWISAIWMSFALTLRHSWRFAFKRVWLVAPIGALGAPLAYLSAAHGWRAVEFPRGTAIALLTLGVAWALALPIMLMLARQLDGARAAIPPRGGMHAH